MEELIVKFNGNIADAVFALGGKTELITCDTAIVTLPDGSADMLAALPQTEYYEYAEDIAPVSVSRSALSASGISYANNTGLDGNGVIIGIADSGTDFTTSSVALIELTQYSASSFARSCTPRW